MGERLCIDSFELGPMIVSATYFFRRDRFVRVDPVFDLSDSKNS